MSETKRERTYSQQCSAEILRALPKEAWASDWSERHPPTLQDLVDERLPSLPCYLTAAGHGSVAGKRATLRGLKTYGPKSTLFRLHRIMSETFKKDRPVAVFVRQPGVDAANANIVVHTVFKLRFVDRLPTLHHETRGEPHFIVESRKTFCRLIAEFWKRKEGFVRPEDEYSAGIEYRGSYDLRQYPLGPKRAEMARIHLMAMGRRPNYELSLRDLSDEAIVDLVNQLNRKNLMYAPPTREEAEDELYHFSRLAST